MYIDHRSKHVVEPGHPQEAAPQTKRALPLLAGTATGTQIGISSFCLSCRHYVIDAPLRGATTQQIRSSANL